MELRDRLEYCRKCLKRDEKESVILCSLTNQSPAFENTCNDYVRDPVEPEKSLDDSFALGFGKIKEQLDPTVYEKLKLDQNFFRAVVFGFIASIAGAVIWALISVTTGYQIGYMALGVGALVGYTIRFLGKGFEINFAILGALASLFGCLLGNLLSVVGFVSKDYGIGFWQICGTLNMGAIIEIMIGTFQFMDVLFYGIAIYEGFRFAAMRFTEKSLWYYTNKYRQ